MEAETFFSLPKSLSAFVHFFPKNTAPWDWIKNIETALIAYRETHKGKTFLEKKSFWQKYCGITNGRSIGKNVYIGKNVQLPQVCTIEDNVYIGDYTEIRGGALIRKNVIIGEHCLIGNSCEVKNALLMDYVQVAHFNYVGDSILGNYAHLSAGTILSNLRFDQQEVVIKPNTHTGLRKFGAILGDHAQVGCNAVLLPGTLLGKNAIVSVGTVFGGILAENQTVYTRQEFVMKN
ncbi:MAG: UDP-N-acetylglucosamine diphosphorylase [Verrucomicrobiota bacterium]|nr:MAG: UDP-N-acetylglucosamine diphosphorylase [Verrucomicrobiota bacterium]